MTWQMFGGGAVKRTLLNRKQFSNFWLCEIRAIHLSLLLSALRLYIVLALSELFKTDYVFVHFKQCLAGSGCIESHVLRELSKFSSMLLIAEKYLTFHFTHTLLGLTAQCCNSTWWDFFDQIFPFPEKKHETSQILSCVYWETISAWQGKQIRR